ALVAGGARLLRDVRARASARGASRAPVVGNGPRRSIQSRPLAHHRQTGGAQVGQRTRRRQRRRVPRRYVRPVPAASPEGLGSRRVRVGVVSRVVSASDSNVGDLTIRRATQADLPALGVLGASLLRAHYAFDQQRFMAPRGDPEAGYAWFLGTQLKEDDVAVFV